MKSYYENLYDLIFFRYSCRKHLGFMPWRCLPEKHDYEVCLYEQYEYRRALKNYLVKTGQWNKGRFPPVEPIVK
jgi:hypothetical protein